ncbi:LacI family DNA-binding transcriptional regulator [Marinifilum sp. D737]|jgi:LacI family transcriptional regulator|uniref:LacI family DNA-binding transcriptional regulator n=1 Tax=Marinifilum sp. D737 TaxID=2969628 RepID=UPI00227442E3|nr:LacI family DNA-binding transcriptional regulator [Marinifilum sp. D737]MCY1633776.1 LacI family transcriptional regulator [Marinifilum sp. D737]
MRSGQVTIKDIAKELGISASTVSRALKDHPDISAKTKEAVNELAKKWHYKPNAVALSLRHSKSNVIGVIIPEIVHHFFSSVISGIEKIAHEAGYNVMMFQSNESYERELANVQALLSSRVDGVLVSMSKETRNFSHFKELRNNGIPVVFFDRVCNEISSDNVIVDDFAGAFTAVEHLINTGCKRIAHLSAPQHMLLGQNRQKGYRQALLKHKLPIDDELIIKCDSFEEALEKTPDLLRLPQPPDAIFAVNELTAAGALSVVKKTGFRVPDDISIIGFTDGVVSRTSDPALTTLEQHGYEVGLRASELLVGRIKEGEMDYEPVTKVVKTNLIVRGSTKN